MNIEYHEGPPRRYLIDGTRVPSVTTVIGATTDKSGGLMHYAANETCKGVVRYLRRNDCPKDWHSLRDALKGAKLDFSSSTKRASDRGVRVHDMIEAWAERQALPSPTSVHDDDRGYVQAFAKFLVEKRPEFVESEVTVGSKVHGYAGRMDATAHFRVDGDVGLIDFKTSKRVYPVQHFLQVEAYELAAVECGAPSTDFRAVVGLHADGSYSFIRSTADADDFLAHLGAFQAQKRIEKSARKAARA